MFRAGCIPGLFAGEGPGRAGGDGEAEDQARGDDEVRDPLVDALGGELDLLAEAADGEEQVEGVEEGVEVWFVAFVQDVRLVDAESFLK